VRVLAVTKIFPSAVDPTAAPFNRQQFAALGRLPGVDLEVLATVPTFPGARLFARWSAAGRLGAVPREERIDGLRVFHPRTFYVPRVGHAADAALYAASLLPEVRARKGKVDVVLGSWAYPDGAAAVLLARLLGVPAVVKLHGSDMNVVARMPGPRAMMRLLLPRAARVVAVSRGLADAAAGLGVARERIDLVMNGVDSSLFQVRPRPPALAELGLDPARRWLLYVGRLETTKGVLDLVEAMTRVTRADAGLVLVGDGAAREAAQAAAAPLGERVVFAGKQPLPRVPTYLAAAHALVLPSWNEGTPNVLLEALASGRRVVATRVGGCPDVVADPALGLLVPPRDPVALAAALDQILAQDYDARAIAARGARGGWADSAKALHGVLERAIAEGRRR
jgi:teichuronic acid biosynthesis glycosyltransferase TuaC